jgi:hypothetical protein
MSTETNLLCFYSNLIRFVESGLQVDTIYTDFSKAFDTVSHSILIDKLKNVGISGNLLIWFKSYLSDRSQKINNHLSSKFHVPSGVPQGGHLSPLLFLIFLLDIDSCFKYSNFSLFADDLKIYYAILTPDDCLKLQHDLDNLSLWCINNGLNLNVAKCKKITFLRNKNNINFNYNILGENLPNLSSINDLGINFQSNLLFTTHIENICSKALKTLGPRLR